MNKSDLINKARELGAPITVVIPGHGAINCLVVESVWNGEGDVTLLQGSKLHFVSERDIGSISVDSDWGSNEKLKRFVAWLRVQNPATTTT